MADIICALLDISTHMGKNGRDKHTHTISEGVVQRKCIEEESTGSGYFLVFSELAVDVVFAVS